MEYYKGRDEISEYHNDLNFEEVITIVWEQHIQVNNNP